jgi:hypothetical protein
LQLQLCTRLTHKSARGHVPDMLLATKMTSEMMQGELERTRAEKKRLEHDLNAVMLGLRVCPEIVAGAIRKASTAQDKEVRTLVFAWLGALQDFLPASFFFFLNQAVCSP